MHDIFLRFPGAIVGPLLDLNWFILNWACAIFDTIVARCAAFFVNVAFFMLKGAKGAKFMANWDYHKQMLKVR